MFMFALTAGLSKRLIRKALGWVRSIKPRTKDTGGEAAMERALRGVKAAAGRILKPAQDVFRGGYSGYFADPDGHLVEVAWNPDWSLADDGSIRLPSRA